jgi:hypothetical protein
MLNHNPSKQVLGKTMIKCQKEFSKYQDLGHYEGDYN